MAGFNGRRWSPEQRHEALVLADTQGLMAAHLETDIPIGTIASWRYRGSDAGDSASRSPDRPDEFDPPPSWHRWALCANSDPNLFQSAARGRLNEVCRACTFRESCLADVLALPFDATGMWAGTTRQQRHRLLSDGEVLTSDGDGVLFDADSGEVVIVENEQRPAMAPDEARALLDEMVAAFRLRSVPAATPIGRRKRRPRRKAS